MAETNVESYVKNAVSRNCKSDSVTPDELQRVLSESISDYVESRDFARVIRENVKN